MPKLQLPSYEELSSFCKKEDTNLGTPFYVYDIGAHPWMIAATRAVAICFRLPITTIPLPKGPSNQIQGEIEGWLDEDTSHNATIVELAKVREWAGRGPPLAETPEVLLGKALGITINRRPLAYALSYIRFIQESLFNSSDPNILVFQGKAGTKNLTFRATDNTWFIKICECIPGGQEDIKELYIR